MLYCCIFDWLYISTQEDKYTLESHLILATAKPLCLHPSPAVAVLKHKCLSHKYKLNDRKLKRHVYKSSGGYLRRAARWDEYALPLPFQIRKIRGKYSRTNEFMHLQAQGNSPEKRANADCKQLDEKLKRQLNLPADSLSTSSFLITSFDFQVIKLTRRNLI